jgi:hypothetical protein
MQGLELTDRTVIRIRVSSTPGAPGRFVVGVTGPEEPAAAESTFRLDFATHDAASVSPSDLAKMLTAQSSLAYHLVSVLTEFPHTWVTIDLQSSALGAAPWEGLATESPFAATWAGPGATRPVFRTSRELADLALVPLELPIDVVVGEMAGWAGPAIDTFGHPLKHFRAVSGNRLDRDRLRTLIAARPHDIVHIRAEAAWSAGTARLVPGSGRRIEASELRRWVRAGRGPARLVVLETDPASLPAMREIGQRVAGRGGPAVLVTESSAVRLGDFYYSITHDQPLSESWLGTRADPGPAGFSGTALLMARGGDGALSLSKAAIALDARTGRALSRIQVTLDVVGESAGHAPLRPAALTRQLERLRVAARDIERIRKTVYTYQHESCGMEPMTAATAEFEDVLAAAEDADYQTGRVVNTWFALRGAGPLDRVPPDHSLMAATVHDLCLNIGPHSALSIVRNPASIQDDQLEIVRKRGAAGVDLRVVLFSPDFAIEHAERRLFLPHPPAASDSLRFAVRTPENVGPAWLRVGVYYENNLLQSLLIRAQIGRSTRHPDVMGNHAEVEWVLSGSLRDIERFKPKTVNILTNETPSGTHAIAVLGTNFHRQVEFGEAEILRQIDS